MSEPRATPPLTTEPVSTVDVGATPTGPPSDPPIAPAPATYPPAAPAQTKQVDSTDPVNGIGIEGEEDVWDARYSMRNFIGRILLRVTLTIAWAVLAVYTWGYDHTQLHVPAIIAGIVVLFLWLGLIGRMIQARFGHHYRLTTRRLFVSTGVLRRERDQMELLRVQDVFTRQQSLMERLLGLGTVVVVPGEKHLPTFHILGVDDPKGVMDLIWHQARAEQDQRNVRVESM